MPRIFFAFARVSTDSWCLPALWRASPSARNFLTSAICAAVRFGFLARAASICFMSAGQWNANAEALASMSAPNRTAIRVFIQLLLFEGERGTLPWFATQYVIGESREPIPTSLG